MTAMVFVVGGLAVVVGALLALDWYAAGRARKRMIVSARGQQVGNATVDLAVVQREAQADQTQGNTGI